LKYFQLIAILPLRANKQPAAGRLLLAMVDRLWRHNQAILVKADQAAREGGGSGARGAKLRRAGGAALAPPRRGDSVVGQGAVRAGRRGHPARAAQACCGRGAGVGRGARHRWRRRPGGVLIVSVRGPLLPHHGSKDVVGLRVPRLPPQAGLRRAPPSATSASPRATRTPPPWRARVPVRADGQRRGHPLLSGAFPASSSGSGRPPS